MEAYWSYTAVGQHGWLSFIPADDDAERSDAYDVTTTLRPTYDATAHVWITDDVTTIRVRCSIAKTYAASARLRPTTDAAWLRPASDAAWLWPASDAAWLWPASNAAWLWPTTDAAWLWPTSNAAWLWSAPDATWIRAAIRISLTTIPASAVSWTPLNSFKHPKLY